MSLFYSCDICGEVKSKDEVVRCVFYTKAASTRKCFKSLSSKDICNGCYKLVFEKKVIK